MHGPDRARRADRVRYFTNPRAQPVPRDHIDHGLHRSARERPAAERRAERALFDLTRDFLRHQQSAAGYPATQALGDGEHIRPHAVELRAERLAQPSHSGLHLVEDQQRASAIAGLSRRMQELGRKVERPRESLHGLDDHPRCGAVDGCCQRSDVVAGHEHDVHRRARETVPRLRGSPGHGCDRGRAPVKGVLHRDDLLAPRGSKREPQRVLVRFGPTVDEEDSTYAPRREFRQLRGGFVTNSER